MAKKPAGVHPSVNGTTFNLPVFFFLLTVATTYLDLHSSVVAVDSLVDLHSWTQAAFAACSLDRVFDLILCFCLLSLRGSDCVSIPAWPGMLTVCMQTKFSVGTG